jgi:hypothetical protein
MFGSAWRHPRGLNPVLILFDPPSLRLPCSKPVTLSRFVRDRIARDGTNPALWRFGGVMGSDFMSKTDPEHWRDRAAEALTEAVGARDELARWQLIQIAVGYDHLAKRAEEADLEPISETESA